MTTDIKVGDEVIFTGVCPTPTRRSDDNTPAVSSTGIVSAVPGADRVWYLITFPGIGSENFSRREFRLKNDPEERRFLDALDMINAKTGTPGLTSWSDGKVGMALSEFERLAGLLPEVKTGPFEVGETVYFLGYKDGSTLPISGVLEVGDKVKIACVGVEGVTVDASRYLFMDEISRTKP